MVAAHKSSRYLFRVEHVQLLPSWVVAQFQRMPHINRSRITLYFLFAHFSIFGQPFINGSHPEKKMLSDF